MIRWEKLLFYLRDYIVLFLLLSTSVFFLMNNEVPQVQQIRLGIFGFFGTIQKWSGVIQQYRTLKYENELLRSRLSLLAFENSLLKEAYLENDRLRNLLEFKRKSRFHLIPVDIVRQNYQGFSHAFLLDVGERDGVVADLPVLSSRGLVGRVVQATNSLAIVQALDDVNFRVSAMIQRSRVSGIIEPTQSGQLQLNFVPLLADVKVGDVVITSGFSDIYPKGIEIGIVVSVEQPSVGLFKKILVTPSVDLNNIEEAFVVAKREKE